MALCLIMDFVQCISINNNKLIETLYGYWFKSTSYFCKNRLIDVICCLFMASISLLGKHPS